MDKNQKNINERDITAERFVAIFDILGFKNRVMRDKHENIYNDLKAIQVNESVLHDTLGKQSVKELFVGSGIHIVKFSDSIILFSENNSVESFIYFLISARFVFASVLKKDFLVKGGMAYGDVSLDRDKQLYFGQPIIDAYSLQKEVDYIGVVAHNSIDGFKQQEIDKTNKFYPVLNQLLFEGKCPLKKSGLITHLNLNWFRKLVDNENEKGADDIKKDIIIRLKKYYLGVAGSPRRYIENTIDFLNKNEEINLDKINLPSKQESNVFLL